MFYCRSFFLLFFILPKDLRDGSTDREFLAQMIGCGCNFKNWVQNLGGDPAPIKIWGLQTPQCCKPKSEDVVQTYSRNRP